MAINAHSRVGNAALHQHCMHLDDESGVDFYAEHTLLPATRGCTCIWVSVGCNNVLELYIYI